ncbi:MAG: hypothetical protein IT281_01070 [Ignavibacteria bacterium]|nr:hypothetical protein [Ignavibacteria bacterium]
MARTWILKWLTNLTMQTKAGFRRSNRNRQKLLYLSRRVSRSTSRVVDQLAGTLADYASESLSGDSEATKIRQKPDFPEQSGLAKLTSYFINPSKAGFQK